MPVVSFPEYARSLEEALHTVIATGEAVLTSLQIDQRSAVRGFVAGALQFHNGSVLSFREFVDVSQAEPKLMYVYHYQAADGSLIFRYDNAAHRPALPQPAHRHTPSGIEVAATPTLSGILDHILQQAN